jgi:alpha-L-fucosidase
MTEFERTTHPEAQWFPTAGLGLMMHWGIHSVTPVEPSWSMVTDYPNTAGLSREAYYAQAERFDSQDYDPDQWMAAASAAGCRYAVLTTKHHDGYTLWPSEVTRYGTHSHLGGRDLLEPYVAACRKHDMKVGFYFSPRDWSYPGFPAPYVDYDLKLGHNLTPPLADPAENQAAFEAFYTYTRGQIEELLTRYGRVDVLWFDGVTWPGADTHLLETLAWVRSLQPHIVINDRWCQMDEAMVGDFKTPECTMPEEAPEGWWEACTVTNGGWGYNPGKPLPEAAWFVEQRESCNRWGGNFLPNISPGPDGAMPDDFYTLCAELARLRK